MVLRERVADFHSSVSSPALQPRAVRRLRARAKPAERADAERVGGRGRLDLAGPMIPGFCGASNSFFTSQPPTTSAATAPATIAKARSGES